MSPTSIKRIDAEIGATGISIYGGRHWNIEDYNPDLNNQGGMMIYDKMRSSDGEIAASLARITLPLLSAEWRVDQPEGVKEGDEITDFVRDVLLERRNMSSPQDDTFNDFIRQALLMLPFGFMAFEKVWGIDSDGRQVIVKIAPRLPKTFREFQFLAPGGVFSGAVQYVWSPRTGKFEVITIPADKMLLCIFGREGDNYWGRSILRSSYKHWDMKDTILWVGAASVERYGMGALELHANEDATTTERQEAEEAAKQFRAHETQFLFTPPKFVATFHHPPAGSSQGVEWAHYHDQQISRSMMTEFMATGTQQTGSRAIVASKVDLLMMAEKGTADIIESAVNRQVIPELVDRNFGVQDAYPKLKCEDLDKMVGNQWAEMMKLLVDARMVIPDKPLRDYARTIIDLPEEDLATQDRGLPPAINANGNSQPGQPDGTQPSGKPNGNPEGVAKPASEKKNASTALARMNAAISAMDGPRLSRLPMQHERFAAFPEYARYLDTEPVRIWHRVVKGFKDRIVVGLAKQASTVSDAALAKADFEVPLKSSLTKELTGALVKVYTAGRKSVVGERDRQLAGKPYTAAAATQGDEWSWDSEPDEEPTPAQARWVNMLAVGFVGALLGSMGDAARRAGQGARNVTPTPTAAEQLATVTAALHDLSEAVQMANLSGLSNRTFINGRDEQADAMSSQIEEEFYSSIMDVNTCDPCAALDQASQEAGGSDFSTPNPDCEGGDRCRCVTIYVWREQAA